MGNEDNISGIKKDSKLKSQKPQFNKKAWRNEKYNKKVKVDQWKFRNQDRLKKKYIKVLKKEGIQRGENANFTPLLKNRNTAKKLNPAQLKNIRKEKALKKEETHKKLEKHRQFEERQKALESYKAKKLAKNKILSQRTSKGQPLMKGRLELLYQKIKADYDNNQGH